MAAWKYIPVVNACLQILLTVLLGFALGAAGVFSIKHVPVFAKYVFRVALPCLVVRGIGIGVDFYSENFVWQYIGAFILLRALALIIAALALAAQRYLSRRYPKPHDAHNTDTNNTTTIPGELAVVWLNLTWISTVILGIPILTAVFASPPEGAFYGLLAGISSFIFQLPCMLWLFEIHNILVKTPTVPLKPEYCGEWDDSATEQSQARLDTSQEQTTVEISCDQAVDNTTTGPEAMAAGGSAITDDAEHRPAAVILPISLRDLLSSRDVWTKVLSRVARNPVIWGIVGGFIISLSTLGEKYLRASSDENVDELGFFEATLKWFGDTVSPVSLFAMGVWMHHQGRSGLFAVTPTRIGLYMFAKLVATPFVMIGLAKMLELDNRAGRAAVLIATLPISLASFSLGEEYNIGRAELAANVALGTLLLLPTTLVWVAAMDDAELYVV